VASSKSRRTLLFVTPYGVMGIPESWQPELRKIGRATPLPKILLPTIRLIMVMQAYSKWIMLTLLVVGVVWAVKSFSGLTSDELLILQIAALACFTLNLTLYFKVETECGSVLKYLDPEVNLARIRSMRLVFIGIFMLTSFFMVLADWFRLFPVEAVGTYDGGPRYPIRLEEEGLAPAA